MKHKGGWKPSGAEYERALGLFYHRNYEANQLRHLAQLADDDHEPEPDPVTKSDHSRNIA